MCSLRRTAVRLLRRMLATVSLRTSMGSRRSELIGYLVEGTQGEPVRPPSFLKFRVR